jgi:hypothetical protein
VLSRAVGDPGLVCHAIVDLVELYIEDENFAEATRLGHEALVLSEQQDDAMVERSASRALGLAYLALQQPNSALPHASRATLHALRQAFGLYQDLWPLPR